MGETIHAKVSVHAFSARVKVRGGGSGQVADQHIIKRFQKKADFPSLGNKECVYIDIDENITYLWDEENLTYTAIASNWHDIRVINGGEA